MIPLRDTIPSRSLPVATWLLILANVAAFVFELSLGGRELERLTYEFGMVPVLVLNPDARFQFGLDGHPWLGLVTSQFLHAGWIHLIANLWTLWIFGDNVEDRLGSFRFLVFYSSCGVAANVLHLYTNPNSTVPAIGASGAIAGVMGAYFVLFPTARVVTLVPVFFLPLFVEIPAFVFLLFWFATQFASGMLALGDASIGGGIAWWAHIGGFLAGIVLLAFLRPRGGRRRARRATSSAD
ncbi:MAG: rhomboid family intramembrane serine protease [Planctomycetes bacterium]|nr:rhomboid family intramembrane serine protease [Planctomycetota bacterium]